MIFDIQKAGILKRVSALLLDVILLCIVSVGFAVTVSKIVGYDAKTEELRGCYSAYEKNYGVSFELTEAEYNALTEDGRARYDEAYNALIADKQVQYIYTFVVNLTLVITTLSILLAFALLEFIVPLALHNGQTVGKKIFGIGVIRIDGVKLSTPQLLIRTLLGKYTIETMVPVFIAIMIYFNNIGILGVIILGLLLLLQIIFVIFTQTNSCIHDILAGTVVVDLGSQMIFETQEKKLEYINKLHAEQAAKSEY